MSGEYCTVDDVKFYIGRCDIASLTNGNSFASTINSDLMNYAINWADAEIDSKIVNLYDLTITHALHPDWLKHCSAILACTWIFRQAQNGAIPPGIQSFYDEFSNALDEISQAKRQIPGVSPKADPGPSMSNLRHDQRWTDKKIRTMPWLNTGDQSSTTVRSLDINQPFEI